MTVVWVVVGAVAYFAGAGTSERDDAMFELGWKFAAGIAALAVFGMFSADIAPSQMNWSAVTGSWAFMMVIAACWVRSEYPDAPAEADGAGRR